MLQEMIVEMLPLMMEMTEQEEMIMIMRGRKNPKRNRKIL